MKPFSFFFLVSLTVVSSVFNSIAQTNATFQTTMSNCQTQIVTMLSQNNSFVQYNLSANQIVSLTSIQNYPVDPPLFIQFQFVSGNRISFQYSNTTAATPVVLTGVTNISFYSNSSLSPNWSTVTLTIQTPSTNSVTVTPVNSVVIPSDATGPVQIVLESSSDLINWIPSQAGTYGNTYSNRFFRVRAIAQ
jgi:hypothetical protein